MTGCEERAARKITSTLSDRGMLIATGPRSALRLGFHVDVVERSRLYPADMDDRP